MFGKVLRSTNIHTMIRQPVAVALNVTWAQDSSLNGTTWIAVKHVGRAVAAPAVKVAKCCDEYVCV